MSDQNKDDLELGDDAYDDVLDESFEEDFGEDEYLEDLDLEADDLGGFDGLEEDVTDAEFDDEWEESDEGEFIGAGAQKEKRDGFNMSFNAMVITGAIVLGLIVLVFQVVTKKPIASLDTFISALSLEGSSDGVVFGDGNKENATPEKQDTASSNTAETEEKTGFLYDPDILDSMEMELEDTPPMPSTISSEEKTEEEFDAPVIENTVELPEFSDPAPMAANQIPRSPEENTTKLEEALSDLEIPKEVVKEPVVNVKAEDFLKEKIEARKEEKETQREEITQEVAEMEKPESVPEAKTSVELKNVQEEKPVIESSPQTNDVSVAVSGDILKKLDIIVSRLDDVESQINQIKQSGNSQIKDMSDTISSLKTELGAIKSAPAPKVAAAKTPSVAKKKSVKKAVPKKRVSKPKVSWELRAAQPGKAWVSQKGQDNMQPVVVGDTLSGVGRITSISYSGGRWVVQGTSGRIRQ